MKKYLISTDFKFWIFKEITKTTVVKFSAFTVLFLFLISSPVHAQNTNRFSVNDRLVINSVIGQFKRECSSVAALDNAKLKEIQDYFQSKKDTMSEDLKSCYGEYLSQLVATHNIHSQTCDEVTIKKRFERDKDLARIFINVKKYQTGIRSYHEKLNECLVRKGASPKELISYSDTEKNARVLSKKVREIDLTPPFRENSVNYR